MWSISVVVMIGVLVALMIGWGGGKPSERSGIGGDGWST